MFIRKKVLDSMLYDIEWCKKCIETLRKEIDEVKMLAYRGGYVVLNKQGVPDEYNYLGLRYKNRA